MKFTRQLHGCPSEAYPSLVVNTTTGWGKCHSCGWRGKVSGGVYRRPSRKAPGGGVEMLRVLKPQHFEYLRSRGLAIKEINALLDQDLVASSPQMPNFILFPITYGGEVKSYVGRWANLEINPYGRRFKSGPGSKDYPWGADECLRGRPLWLVEGIFDALYLKLRRKVEVVAALGWPPIESQLVRILDYIKPSEIILSMDKDASKATQISKRLKSLSRYTPVGVELAPSQYKDWGEMLKEG